MKIFNYTLDEIEMGSLALLICGFILSLTTGSAIIYYIIAFLTSVLFGRMWYRTIGKEQFKYAILITFFIVGFLVGNILSKYGDARITLGIFIIGIAGTTFYFEKNHPHKKLHHQNNKQTKVKTKKY